MASYLLDEDMPRRTASALRSEGFDVLDVREVGLRGMGDMAIFAYAQTHRRSIVSRDLGFANTLTFPLGTHHGIIVLRLPSAYPIDNVIAETYRALAELSPDDLYGTLVIVEPGRTRVRRKARG
ncbi:MAG: hypothetical protein DCC58_06610 [Chloroflexi bacterium]|nr:MAG: hypothetical protein DCC58_06610 [Chloroflexota bacterium]